MAILRSVLFVLVAFMLAVPAHAQEEVNPAHPVGYRPLPEDGMWMIHVLLPEEKEIIVPTFPARYPMPEVHYYQKIELDPSHWALSWTNFWGDIVEVDLTEVIQNNSLPYTVPQKVYCPRLERQLIRVGAGIDWHYFGQDADGRGHWEWEGVQTRFQYPGFGELKILMANGQYETVTDPEFRTAHKAVFYC